MADFIDHALILVESSDSRHPNGNDDAIGDLNLTQKAYGCLQIRQPVCEDVNKKYGTHFKAQDMLGRRSLSLGVFWLYMSIYATSANLGRLPTDEDRARIWNGGPSAWNPSSPLYKATSPYWARARARLGQ